MSLCFSLTWDSVSRNGRRQGFMVAWVSVIAAPSPKKNSPFAAQLKIAFRRFLFCDGILLAGTAVPFMNKEFTGKSSLTLFCSVLKAVKNFFKFVHHISRTKKCHESEDRSE